MNFAIKGTSTHYTHNDEKKFNSAIIFNYHLEKTEQMNFVNQDGEVEEFISIDLDDFYKILEKKLLKPNCIIPIIDFLILKKGDFISKKAILEIKKIYTQNEY